MKKTPNADLVKDLAKLHRYIKTLTYGHIRGPFKPCDICKVMDKLEAIMERIR